MQGCPGTIQLSMPVQKERDFYFIRNPLQMRMSNGSVLRQ